MKNQVTIVETSPRDGLPAFPGGTTKNKISYINLLAEAGLQKIECVNFLHPRIVPENADAEEILKKIRKKKRVTYVGLIQNLVGGLRALETDVDEILMMLAASDAYNKALTGNTTRETIHNLLPTMFNALKGSGRSTRIYLVNAFGCPFTGNVPYDIVEDLVLKAAHLGADEIVLMDDQGMATPRQVKELIGIIQGLRLDVRLAVHFHNVRGLGLANCLAAFDSGIRIFDASLGGLNRTPIFNIELPPGSWNVATEDLVYMFEGMGVKTGIDVDRLLMCVRLAEKYIKRKLPGHLSQATISARLIQAKKDRPASKDKYFLLIG